MEVRSLLSKAVYVWRFEIGVTMAGEVTPTPVIGEDEDNIRLRGTIVSSRVFIVILVGGGRVEGACYLQDEEEGGEGGFNHN